MNNCEHKKFKTAASINRSINHTINEDTKTESTTVTYFLKLTINCEECGQVFEIVPPLLDKNSMEISPKIIS